jgi:glycosyltransferase involved in cell wall biosynthesis
LRRLARTRLASLRRAFGQTRWARSVSSWRRARIRIPRALPPDPALLSDETDAELLAEALLWAERHGTATSRRSPRRPPRACGSTAAIRNVLFISHCDFTGNSAVHAYRIASELHERGLSPVLAVPDDPNTVHDVGRPPFPVIPYRDARAGRFHFPDGRGPDLVHAFTPRERVRKLATQIVAAARCRYVAHLEDNDRAVLAAELETSIEQLQQLPAPVLDRFVGAAQMHPLRGPHFLERAAGVSVVIDRLLEFAPQDVPAAIVKPGFDEAVLTPDRSRDEVRAELGISAGDFAIVYTGTLHISNVSDMRRLYVALAALRRDGHPIVFVKTGWNAPDAPELQHLGDGVRNLGWVPRSALPGLLAAADALVQPGVPGPFNDYRFPAKLPDFLASGRPVILSRTNIGLALQDGREAFVLENGNAAEIYRAIETLRAQPELARTLGEQGRAFALRELRWESSVDAVQRLYAEVEGSAAPEAWTLELPPPVRVVALVSEPPSAEEARLARRHGIYGFRSAGGGGSPDDAVVFSEDYKTALRRRVLQALGRAEAQEPIVVIDPRGPISRADWLDATRSAVRDGIRQYYASRRVNVKARAVEDMLRLDSSMADLMDRN